MKSLLNPIFEYCEDESLGKENIRLTILDYIRLLSKQIKVDNCAEEASCKYVGDDGC